jgi:DNA invertase Pin-like site-specific DNA recombinase
MKVALYARVSKADESQNPENQLMRLRSYAQECGYEVSEDRVYVDMASGVDANRPQLDRMMADARARRFSLVLCVKVDRLARSVSNLYALLSEFDARGVKFECIDQSITTNTPTGKLLLSILGGVAEFERELIRDRTKAGLARAKAQGKRLGRPRKRVNMERAHELRAQGFGYRKIASEVGVSYVTVRDRLRKEGGDAPIETVSESKA